MERKTLNTAALEVKDAARGEVVAEIGTPGTVDKDGDVFLAGSTQPPSGAKVKISGYSHDVVTDGAPPAGAGVVTEEGGKILLRGRFFMGTTRGRESFEVVKELGPDGQWSVGFPESSVAVAPLTTEWREKGARRLISAYTPVEASPVFMGAQHGTRTLAVKRARDTEDAVRAAGLKTLKSLMAENELSHREVADALEVSVPTLRRILTGQEPLPDLSTLKAVREPVQRPTRDRVAVEASLKEFNSWMGERYGPSIDRPVPAERRQAAEITLRWGAERMGLPVPTLKFFQRGDFPDGWRGCYRRPTREVWVRDDLEGSELAWVLFHELHHHDENLKGQAADEVDANRTARNLLNTYALEASPQWQMQRRMALSRELFNF